jgi:uncharacterized membrane-anchored protein YhcB (DUF1043 family)
MKKPAQPIKTQQASDDQFFDYLEIDKYRLDEQWCEHPRRFGRCARKLARAQRDVRRAKAHLAEVAAKLNLEIRAYPSNFSIEKITDDVVKNAVVLQPEYKEANAKFMDAEDAEAELEVQVKTLDHFKRGLEKMVDLHGQDYFSGIKTR